MKYDAEVDELRLTVQRLNGHIRTHKRAWNNVFNIVVDHGTGLSEKIRKISETIMNKHWNQDRPAKEWDDVDY
jgi:hypothetical protein